MAVLIGAACLPSCGGDGGSATVVLPVEFVELGNGGTPRRVYDAQGLATDVRGVAALALRGTARGIVPGGGNGDQPRLEPPPADQLIFELSTQDSDRLREWTAARIGKPVAFLVGDQVLIQAQVNAPLSGASLVPIPAQIRSAELRAVVEQLRSAGR